MSTFKILNFNQKREIEDFVNDQKLTKEQIVSILQGSDEAWTLIYYSED